MKLVIMLSDLQISKSVGILRCTGVQKQTLEGGMRAKSPFSTKFNLERNICSLMHSFTCRIAVSSKT